MVFCEQESKYAQDRKKRIILIRMIPFEQDFENRQARFMFGLNKLVLPWMLGTPMPTNLPDQVFEALGIPEITPEPQGTTLDVSAEAPTDSPEEAKLRRMKLGALSQRAKVAGASAQEIEDAQDDDAPKDAVGDNAKDIG